MSEFARPLGPQERATIEKLMRSRTAPAGIYQRACIISWSSEGQTPSEIAARLGHKFDNVAKWIRRFNEEGLAGLEEKPGRGRKPSITPTQALEVVETALSDPGWLKLGFTVWSVRRLRGYLLQSGRFTHLAVGTLYAILRGTDLVIRQCRSWFGRFGQSKDVKPEEFEVRKADVIQAYQELPDGEVTVCVDVKRVYHRPEAGACWQHQRVRAHRRARYSKAGTRTDILGALAIQEPEIQLQCTASATGEQTGKFLVHIVMRWIEAGKRLIHLVMDNSSVNTSALKQPLLEPLLPYIQVHWTPTHASWLDLAEPMWSSFQRAVIRGSNFNNQAEVEVAVEHYQEYWQAHPHRYRWPKPQPRHRQRTPLLWERLSTIPIISWTVY
jgi:transposase